LKKNYNIKRILFIYIKMTESKMNIETTWWGETIDYGDEVPKIETIEDKHRKLPQTENDFYTGKEDIWKKIEFYVNEKGQKIKRTILYRKYLYSKRVYKAAEERRKTWTAFGDKKKKGKEVNITTQLNQVVNMIKPNEKEKSIVDKLKNIKLGKWSKKKKKEVLVEKPKSKYIAPHLRSNYKQKYKPASMNTNTNIRIANLNEDTTEDVIRQLCYPFGKVRFIKMLKDFKTKRFYGTAFVGFCSDKSVERAINDLNGKRFYYSVLECTRAKTKKM